MVHPPNPRRSFLGLSALGLVLLASLGLLSRLGARMVEGYVPRLDAAREVREELSSYHVMYEGWAHGSHDESGPHMFEELDQAERWTRALLDGDEGSHGRIEPTRDPIVSTWLRNILADIDELRTLSDSCYADRSTCAENHARVDAVLERSHAHGALVENQLRAWLVGHAQRHRALRNSALVASLLLALGVGIVLANWSRAWARAFSTIQSYNQRLTSEIEERRTVEAELRESERRFRLMADGAPMLMWMADLEMNFVFLNQTWLDFTGRPRDTQIGRGWSEGIHVDDRDRLLQICQGALERRTAFQVEYRLRRADGEFRWLLHRGVPRIDGDGEFVGFIGSCVDITGRRRAEDALRDSESRFRAMAEAAHDPVLLVDDSGRITHWNPAGEVLFGYSEAEILGRRYFDLLAPEGWRDRVSDAERRFRLLGPDATEGGTLLMEGRRKDGVVIPVELSVAPLTISGRWHAIVIARDISERKRSEMVNLFVRDTIEAVIEGARADSLLGTVCSRVREIFGFEVAWVATRDSKGTMAVRGRSGRDDIVPGGLRADWTLDPDAAGPALEALRSGRLVSEVAEPNPGRPYRTVVGVPLAVPGNTLGVLALYSTRGDILDDQVAAHLQTVAAQVGIALVRAEDQQQLRLHGTALGAVANAILIMDKDGLIQWVNPAFTELSGYDSAEVVGRDPSFLDTGGEGRAQFEEMWQTVRGGWTWRGEVVERRKDGGPYIVYQTITPLLGDDGDLTHFIAVHTDITAQREVERKLLHMAHHDDLTGLANRALFTRHLRRAIASVDRSGTGFAVHLLDLDRFKDVNDTLGHPVGDLLLKAVGSRLVEVVRPSDTVARFGGDEFAILQPDIGRPADAAALAQKVIALLQRPFRIGEHEIHTAASIGVSVNTDEMEDPEELLIHADTALYKAKDEGRGTFRFHTDAMQQEVVERVVLQGDLRRALHRDELLVYYQPQVDLNSGRIVGMEALVRWQHPKRGLLAPGGFIRVAEDSGIIVQMGLFVLRTVCRQARAWKDAGLPEVPVAVNLSAVQFKAVNFAEQVVEVLEEEGLDPHRLEMELTETILMQSLDKVDRTLARLHGIGVRFSIDDFGTGYSSLQYLKRFPIYKLKIAQEFVRDLGVDPSDAAIVGAVIGLAGSLGLKVIAEGVETLEQLEFLRRAGCQEAQGYYYYHPVPVERMTELLEGEAGSRPSGRVTLLRS